MSLSSETQRVQQGVKDSLKTLIQKLGGTVASERVDGYPALADAISNKLLPDNLLSDDTAALYGKGAEATPNDVFATIPALLKTKSEIHLFSYEGTGTYDGDIESGGVSVTADKEILLVGVLLEKDNSTGEFSPTTSTRSSDNNANTIMVTSALATTYTKDTGIGDPYSSVGLYAKKSSDGKTVYWTSTNVSGTHPYSGRYGFNEAGYTYYGFYIC